MGILKHLFRTKVSQTELSNGALLVRIFEDRVFGQSDVVEFREVCESQDWKYAERVIQYTDQAFMRSLKDCQGEESYRATIDSFSDSVRLFQLQDAELQKLHLRLMATLLNYFLGRLKKLSKTHLEAIEVSIHSYAARRFNIEDDSEVRGVLAMASVKSNVRFIRVMLMGEDPRYDLILEYYNQLVELLQLYGYTDSKECIDMMFELSELMFEKIYIYLLLTDEQQNLFQFPEHVFEETLKCMNTIQYCGVWTQKFDQIAERSNHAFALAG